MTFARASLDRLELEYETAGADEPVVFIHGVLITDAFRPLMREPALSERYRLINYHRRGYAGSSPAPSRISIQEQAADCLALLRHLEIERAHVVGASLGGDIALQLALDTPEAVRSLALLEPALMVGESAAAYRESLARAAQRYQEADAAVVVAEFMEARWPEYREILERELPGALARAVTDSATTFQVELPGLLDWKFGETEARRIRQPALLMLGGESATLWDRLEETHRLMLQWLPDAEGLILPRGTHFFQTEHPRDTAEGLAAFLARHPL